MKVEEIESLINKSDLKKLKTHEIEGEPVIETMLSRIERLSQALLDIDKLNGGTLESIRTEEDIKSVVNGIYKITPSSNDMSAELDRLQRKLKEINSSL